MGKRERKGEFAGDGRGGGVRRSVLLCLVSMYHLTKREIFRCHDSFGGENVEVVRLSGWEMGLPCF